MSHQDRKSAISSIVPADQVSAEEAESLASRMKCFYQTIEGYKAYVDPPPQDRWLAAIKPHVEELIKRKGSIRVLELGAGRPAFLRVFGSLRDKVEYWAQDISDVNRGWLSEQGAKVIIGRVSDVPGMFDLVFSLFVFEHVAQPRQWLCDVAAKIAAGGIHVVVCPRYDMPGYLCPSLRHLPPRARLDAHVKILDARLRARVSGQPAFLVNREPACLSVPWFRDSDAVHVVSSWDVGQWHRQNGFRVERLRVGWSGFEGWMFSRLFLVALVCRRMGVAEEPLNVVRGRL